MSIKILLLEDDLLFAETLVDLLEDNCYVVSHYPNGQEALDATFESKFDIYILDINVPLIDGISLLKELRESGDETATIFLTSHKDKESLKNGFLSGCDDYIRKPFDNDELIFRIEALVKRYKKDKDLVVGKLSHNFELQSISYADKELNLSKKEYELLLLLMLHANKVVPKELIVDKLWNLSESHSDGAIRVYINRLKQIDDIEIENIRGIGYRLVS